MSKQQRSSSSRKKSSGQNFDKFEFVNINLSEEDIAVLDGDWEIGLTHVDWLEECILAGHKISFSFNNQTDMFTCSVTGVRDHCVNAGLVMVSSAETVRDAIRVAQYKFDRYGENGRLKPELGTGKSRYS